MSPPLFARLRISSAPASDESTASSPRSGDNASAEAKLSTGVVNPTGETTLPSGRLALNASVVPAQTVRMASESAQP